MKNERITLVENNKVVSGESKLEEIFSKYFGNIVQNLGIDGLTNISSDKDTVTIRKAIKKYQNHPSIKVIWENFDTTNNFSFDLIDPECISKIINNLDSSKALLTDLSKGFDCLPHDLLIAKLHTYGIKKGSFNLLFSYLKIESKEFV